MFKCVEKYLEVINRNFRVKVKLRIPKDKAKATVYFYCNIDGVVDRKVTKFVLFEDITRPEKNPTMIAILKLRDEKELELRGGSWSPIIEKALRKRTELFGYMDEWIEANYSKFNTKRNFKSAFRLFKTFWGERSAYVEEVSRDDLKKYRKWLLGLELRSNSRALMLRSVATFFNSLEKDDIIAKSPARRIRLSEVETVVEYLTEEEMRRISSLKYENLMECVSSLDFGKSPNEKRREIYLRNLKEREFDPVPRAFVLAMLTGFRISDVEQLSTEHIKDDSIQLVMQKTSVVVSIPIEKDLRKILEIQCRVEHPRRKDARKVFVLPSRQRVSWVLKLIAKACDITKDLVFRHARKSFATRLARNDVALHVTSKLLGHKSTITTEKHYAQVEHVVKERAIACLPSFSD